jgi:hypothetical protein
MKSVDAAALLIGMAAADSAPAGGGIERRTELEWDAYVGSKVTEQESKKRYLCEQTKTAHVQARSAGQQAAKAAEDAQNAAMQAKQVQEETHKRIKLAEQLQAVAKRAEVEWERAKAAALEAVMVANRGVVVTAHMFKNAQKAAELAAQTSATAKDRAAQASAADEALNAQEARIKLFQEAMAVIGKD